jgi:hypothetical protein
MLKVSICQDLKKCQELWERLWPKECLFDLWAVRNCFAKYYAHLPEFYIAEDDGNIIGMLPLSWIEETQRYSFFPGELWQGKTWLEQNKIVSFKPFAAKALLENVSKPMHLRYLLSGYLSGIFPENEENRCVIDETGYLFMPAQYDYSFDMYMNGFSTRSRKKLIRELNPIETHGLRYRFDHFPDIEKLFQMNICSFKENSYFYDQRFLRSFEALAGWLKAQGMLHIITLLLGDKVVAVDIGAVWNSSYTVLAGGTNPEFPGVAKMINFQHLKWACLKKLAIVDFLCGDFGWKSRFHLQPRPLYLIDTSANTVAKSNLA